jgi:hypothetical protein
VCSMYFVFLLVSSTKYSVLQYSGYWHLISHPARPGREKHSIFYTLRRPTDTGRSPICTTYHSVRSSMWYLLIARTSYYSYMPHALVPNNYIHPCTLSRVPLGPHFNLCGTAAIIMTCVSWRSFRIMTIMSFPTACPTCVDTWSSPPYKERSLPPSP